MGNRIASWAIALAVGLVYGAAGSAAHAATWLGLPVGVFLAVVGSGALLLAVRLLVGDRWAALAAGLGMMIATFVLAQPSAGGSVLFTQAHEIAALVWMAAVPVWTALVVAFPDPARLGRPTAEPR
ncbi:histidinol dehydrogenase [Microbacterium sp. GXF7504]